MVAKTTGNTASTKLSVAVGYVLVVDLETRCGRGRENMPRVRTPLENGRVITPQLAHELVSRRVPELDATPQISKTGNTDNMSRRAEADKIARASAKVLYDIALAVVQRGWGKEAVEGNSEDKERDG